MNGKQFVIISIGILLIILFYSVITTNSLGGKQTRNHSYNVRVRQLVKVADKFSPDPKHSHIQVNATSLTNDIEKLSVVTPEYYPDFEVDLKSMNENITISGGDQPRCRNLRPRVEKDKIVSSESSKDSEKVSIRKCSRSNVVTRASESPKKKSIKVPHYFLNFNRSFFILNSFCPSLS